MGQGINTENKFGFSKKTNVAIAAMTTLTMAQDSWWTVIAITVLGLVSLLVQGRIDMKKIKTNKQEVQNETE